MMENQLAEVIVEKGITYHLVEDGYYYPQLSLERKVDYGERRGNRGFQERESDRVIEAAFGVALSVKKK